MWEDDWDDSDWEREIAKEKARDFCEFDTEEENDDFWVDYNAVMAEYDRERM